MKTDKAISSGFRAVFPKPTKKSLLMGISRVPPAEGKLKGSGSRETPALLSVTRVSEVYKCGHAPFDTTVSLQFPAARTGFRSELGYALTMLPPRV